jgi:hypothetical protein
MKRRTTLAIKPKKSARDTEFEEPRAADGDNILSAIAALARDQLEAEIEVEKATEVLKEANEKLSLIAKVKLPALMDEAEQTEITTKDGIRVSIKESYKASISQENSSKALKWLEENGHENLIKREFKIEFGKDEESWAKKFEVDLSKRKRPLKHELKRTVHATTLAAFVREQVGEGEDIPLDLFGAYRMRQAKLTVKD